MSHIITYQVNIFFSLLRLQKYGISVILDELFDYLAGIEEEHVHYGRSLVPQLNGMEGDARHFVFAEGGYSTHEPRDFEG